MVKNGSKNEEVMAVTKGQSWQFYIPFNSQSHAQHIVPCGRSIRWQYFAVYAHDTPQI